MRHYLIDEVKRGEHYARQHRVHRRDHWWFGVPVNPVCWLLGHRPTVHQHHHGGTGGKGYAVILCARCGSRPHLREVHAKKLADGEWVPEPYWLTEELDNRDGWSAGRRGELTLTTIVPRRPRVDLAAHLHVGGLGSETPWDLHVGVGGLDVYLGVGLGGKLAERVTGKAHSRDLRLDISPEESAHPAGLRVWWDLWTGEDMGGSHLPAASWRSGYTRVSVGDWLWGKPGFRRNQLAKPVTLDIDLGDGLNHRVAVTLEEHLRGRERQNPLTWDREWFVDWNLVRADDSAPIGTKLDSEGRYMRGRVFGSGFRLTKDQACSERWLDHAIVEFRAHVSQMRAREETRAR